MTNSYPSDTGRPVVLRDMVDLAQRRAAALPEQIAYSFVQYDHDVSGHVKAVSYADVDFGARAAAACLQKYNPRGKRVILIFPPGIEYILSFFACLYAGALAVPVYPPVSARDGTRALSIITNAAPDFILTCDLFERQARQLASSLSRPVTIINVRHIPDGNADDWVAPDINAESIAFLQYTSGSTGSPKGVMISHGNLLHNLELISENFEAGPESRGVIWLPPYHDMGLIGGILVPMYNAFPVTLMSPLDFLQEPVRWLRAVSEHQADISGGPNFAYELCVDRIAPQEVRQLDLSSWTLAFNGSETIRLQTVKRFVKKFGTCGFRMEAFYPCYGLAESTLIVTGGRKSEFPKTITLGNELLTQNKAQAMRKTDRKGRFETTLTGCGRPLIRDFIIVDPETHALKADNEVGEVWIRGPSVACGYWHASGETGQQFHAYTQGAADGPFFRTGDLGFLNGGEFYLTGRRKELILINGRNYYPVDIEYSVEQSYPAFRKGCAAAFSVDTSAGERLVVVQEVRRADVKSFDVQKAATAVFQAVLIKNGLHVAEVAFLAPSTIPKTTSGKICRISCLAQYRSGKLGAINTVYNPKSSRAAGRLPANRDVLTKLRNLPIAGRREYLLDYLRKQVAAVVGLDSFKAVSAGTPLFDLGLDSLAAVELKERVELDLECRLETTVFIDYPTCEAMTDHLADHVPAADIPGRCK